jgi:hypothetical protein
MSYYKITFESDTVEGLKAIQGGFLGNGTSATDSTTFETTVAPPRQQDGESPDLFSGDVQAPPPAANEAGARLDKNAFYPPPPDMEGSPVTDIGLQGEIPPPPRGEEGDEAQPNEVFTPPKQPTSKSPNAGKKSSK